MHPEEKREKHWNKDQDDKKAKYFCIHTKAERINHQQTHTTKMLQKVLHTYGRYYQMEI